jgi:hypothetical protein
VWCGQNNGGVLVITAEGSAATRRYLDKIESLSPRWGALLSTLIGTGRVTEESVEKARSVAMQLVDRTDIKAKDARFVLEYLTVRPGMSRDIWSFLYFMTGRHSLVSVEDASLHSGNRYYLNSQIAGLLRFLWKLDAEDRLDLLVGRSGGLPVWTDEHLKLSNSRCSVYSKEGYNYIVVSEGDSLLEEIIENWLKTGTGITPERVYWRKRVIVTLDQH